MRKPIRITTPYPTTEEVARIMGVSPARTKELQAMAVRIMGELREKQAIAARKAERNGGSAKRKRSAAKARVS
jgi:hypothetical protein